MEPILSHLDASPCVMLPMSPAPGRPWGCYGLILQIGHSWEQNKNITVQPKLEYFGYITGLEQAPVSIIFRVSTSVEFNNNSPGYILGSTVGVYVK